MNLTIQPYGTFQKNLKYFDIYNNYNSTGAINLTYNVPLLITSYLSQGDNWDENVSGELDTTDTIIEHDIHPSNIYNNHNLINYSENSIFL